MQAVRGLPVCNLIFGWHIQGAAGLEAEMKNRSDAHEDQATAGTRPFDRKSNRTLARFLGQGQRAINAPFDCPFRRAPQHADPHDMDDSREGQPARVGQDRAAKGNRSVPRQIAKWAVSGASLDGSGSPPVARVTTRG